ncbi:hypothetical protein PHISCL_05948 [Aspergillus sclerotialis]|uniref:Nucleolar protein 9 n=1 Tax=Aspergillus sclerotialis TaxID=2070753 RepID=A0A3A2ZEW6_9EURO|nr:hypothetical protein PHISCL_05948 [Aspergillus sclerotialis]
MPREKKKRGRRAEEKAKKDTTKRKRDEIPDEQEAKRFKPSTDDAANEFNHEAEYIPLGEDQSEAPAGDTPFYGLLDEEEQEYFARANEVLELNQFQDGEERRLFVDSVYQEADGKELKIACSQSCSRLMEKLIAMSDVRQIQRLFNKFIGHFLHLVQHRFASHCCETLFIHAAPAVTQKAPKKGKRSDEDDGAEPEMSLAEMFMTVVEELEGNWGYLLTERFASHTIRMLLLVLAGEPVDISSSDSVVASRKKEKLGAPDVDAQDSNTIGKRRNVPEFFETTLKKVMNDMVSVLDDTYLRALATHPVGNPVLQVLLYLELSHFGKSSVKESNSITKRLISDENLEEGSESATFVRGLLYDPVGSRLLEAIVRYVPGKFFKKLYKNLIHDRIGQLARNITAGYVVLRVLERLGKDDLQDAMELIIPEIPALIERSRMVVPKVLVERCVARGVSADPLAQALEGAYDKDPALRLNQMLRLETAPKEDAEDEEKPKDPGTSQQSTAAEKLHGSLLVQTMLSAAGRISELIFASLLAQSPSSLLQMSKDPTASRVIQQALTSPTSTPQFRRQFTAKFFGHLKELALDSSGSHVVDALWTATKDIFFVKERMAQELAQNEMTLRDSFLGRAVWRNWSMDLYKRRRPDWARRAKGLDQSDDGNGQEQRPKSRIELARAKFAAKEDAVKNKQAPVAAKT